MNNYFYKITALREYNPRTELTNVTMNVKRYVLIHETKTKFHLAEVLEKKIARTKNDIEIINVDQLNTVISGHYIFVDSKEDISMGIEALYSLIEADIDEKIKNLDHTLITARYAAGEAMEESKKF